MLFIFFQNLFSSLRKSNFRILQFLISSRHQMPKHKTRNTFHWIIWEVNTVCYWNLASLCHIIKEKNTSKNFCKNCGLKTSSRPFCVWKELSIASTGKWNFWRKLLVLYRYVIAKLSKFVQISMLTFSDSFLKKIL